MEIKQQVEEMRKKLTKWEFQKWLEMQFGQDDLFQMSEESEQK